MFEVEGILAADFLLVYFIKDDRQTFEGKFIMLAFFLSREKCLIDCFCHIQDTRRGGALQRCSQCILKPQPIGQLYYREILSVVSVEKAWSR